MAKVIVKYPEMKFFQFFDVAGQPYFKHDFTLPLFIGLSDEEVMCNYRRLREEMGFNVYLFEMTEC